MKTSKKIHILGAVIIDIIAQKNEFTKGTSNPCELKTNIGGVGFNIFKNLQDFPAQFHTVIGNDHLTPLVKESLDQMNAHYKVINNLGNGIYLAFMEGGELLVSAIDSRTVEEGFSENFLLEIFKKVSPGDFIAFDSNLPPQIIPSLIEKASKLECPLYFETVSVEKTFRSTSLIKKIELLTPTVEELAALVPSLTDDDIFNFMNEREIRNIILTEGKKGLTHFSQNSKIHYNPTQVLKVKDTNGAGDFLFSCLIKSLFSGENYPTAIINSMNATENYLINLNHL